MVIEPKTKNVVVLYRYYIIIIMMRRRPTSMYKREFQRRSPVKFQQQPAIRAVYERNINREERERAKRTTQRGKHSKTNRINYKYTYYIYKKLSSSVLL